MVDLRRKDESYTMRTVVTGYCLTDSDHYLIMVGRSKRKIVTAGEHNQLPIIIFKTKKQAELALQSREQLEVSPSANTYIKQFKGYASRNIKKRLTAVPCTAVYEF